GERSDSSGLLDVGDEPWTGVPASVGDPDAPAGALPGAPAPEPPENAAPLAPTPPAGAPEPSDTGAPLDSTPVAGAPNAAAAEEQLDDFVPPLGWLSAAQPVVGDAPLPPSPAPTPSSGERPKASAVTAPVEAGPPAAQQDPGPAADAPLETGALLETEAPLEAGAPAGTHAPSRTDAPVGTDAPVETDSPVGTDAPLVRDAPQQEGDDGGTGGPDGETVDQEVPERQEDHVAIVQPAGAKDTDSWDVPGGALPWLVPFAVRPPAEDEQERAKPDHALRDSAPWEDTTFATWRRATLGEGEQPKVPDQPLRCGGPDYTPEQLAEMRAAKEAEEAEAAREAAADDEDDEGDGTERSSADLLVRDDSAWGGGRAVPPSGGIG
ncbi:hypothetical protein ABT324_10880, partial [Saccharopolyspora sp. NPDC000359]